MRLSIRSERAQDLESSQSIKYFVLSREFGWTPEQIDDMDLEMINKYVTILNELKEIEAQEHRKSKNKRAIG